MKVALFFEVQVREGLTGRYLELAAALKPALDAMGGCLFIDRFKSLTRQNLLLSYQIWRDEASISAWRADGKHHAVQSSGRSQVFSDYRIRVAPVVHEELRGSSPWRPEKRSAYNDPSRREPTFALIAESKRGDLAAKRPWKSDRFESVYRPGVFSHLVDVPSEEAGIGFGRELLADPAIEYFRVVEVIRDYGMFDRREAPQYYPPATRI